jgi:histidinol-phosphate/aromatic aminotransferase/cobyric acid decarboxylase-like protein/adenosyl cobinamide kinase/adenosyl cobinamide phosphate guanylyltransferase
MGLILVTGGIRSGKSEVAEQLAADAGRPVVYVATGSVTDAEMAERIALHRARRPLGWRTVETPDVPAALEQVDADATVLVDSLGGWVAHLMERHGLWTEAAVEAPGGGAWAGALEAVRELASSAARRAGLTVVVVEESGLGVVPQGAGVRRHLDLAGEASRALAEVADRVILVIAGQPVEIKRPPMAAIVPEALRLHGDALAPPGCLDFAVTVVPGGPPEPVRQEVAAALEQLSRYPDEAPAILALAERHRRAPAEVLPLAGSVEAFWLLARALAPRRAVVVCPSFTEAEAALRAAGRPVTRVLRDEESFALDPSRVPADADLVFTCNPNNPTGTLDPAATLERLARPGRVLVVDEAFMELVPDEAESLAARRDLPGLVVLRSVTKAWSLPGIRAGYLLAPPDIVAALRAARPPWAVATPALAALAACARDRVTPRTVAREVAAARAELVAALATLPGVRVWPSAANFLLLRVPDGPRVRRRLLERGIAVRPADTFPGLGPDHLRVTVRRPEENAVLVRALEEALG